MNMAKKTAFQSRGRQASVAASTPLQILPYFIDNLPMWSYTLFLTSGISAKKKKIDGGFEKKMKKNPQKYRGLIPWIPKREENSQEIFRFRIMKNHAPRSPVESFCVSGAISLNADMPWPLSIAYMQDISLKLFFSIWSSNRVSEVTIPGFNQLFSAKEASSTPYQSCGSLEMISSAVGAGKIM